MNVGEQIVARLSAWGVRCVFRHPGDGIDGVMGALTRSEPRIELIEPRHEEMVAFMACAHAEFAGQLGVCNSTAGPAPSTS